MKLKITMKNDETIILPLNHRTEITFKHDRIHFTQYYEIGYKPYDLAEDYYFDEINEFVWI